MASSASHTRKLKKPPACRQCRKRKIGCDRGQPMCGNCIKYGRSTCTYPDTTGKVFEMDANRAQQIRMKSHSPDNILNNSAAINNGTINPAMISNNNNNNNNNNTMSSNGVKNNMNMNINTNSNMLPMKGRPSFTKYQLNTNTKSTRTPAISSTNIIVNNNNYNNTPKIVNKNTSSRNINSNNNTTFQPHMIKNVTNNINLNYTNKSINSIDTGTNLQDFQPNSRVQLLNANINSMPSLFNPNDINNSTQMDINSYNNSNNNNNNNVNENIDGIEGDELVFYDLMTSVYTQEEILLKEMEFLKDTFLQLKKFKGKYFDNKNNNNNNENDIMKNNISKIKKIKTIMNDNNPNKSITNTNNVKDKNTDQKQKLLFSNITSNFTILDYKNKDMLSSINQSILSNDSKQLNIKDLIKDTPNSIFNLNYLILRDNYLLQFYHSFIKLINLKFNDSINQLNNDQIFKRLNILDKLDEISLISTENIIIVLNYMSNNLSKINDFIPILNFDLKIWHDKINSICEKLNTESLSNLKINQFEINELSFLGQLIIIILIFYSSLQNNHDKENFESCFLDIKLNLQKLMETLYLIQNYFVNRINHNNTSDMDKLNITVERTKFITILKWYLTNFEKSNDFIKTIFKDSQNIDQDIYINIMESINLETKNEELIRIWNFSCTNYIQRKIFNGEFPFLINNSQLLNDIIIRDTKFKNDFELIKSEINLIEYLYQRKHLNEKDKSNQVSNIQINQVIKLLDEINEKFNLLTLNHDNNNNKLSNIINSQTIYEIVIFLEYYLLVEFEIERDYKNFQKQFNKLLNSNIKIILLNQILNLNIDNKMDGIRGYEFLFIDKNLIIMENIIEILFSLYQRFMNLFERNNDRRIPIPSNNEENKYTTSIEKILSYIKDTMLVIAIVLTKVNKDKLKRPNLYILTKINVFISIMIKNNHKTNKPLIHQRETVYTTDPSTGLLVAQPNNNNYNTNNSNNIDGHQEHMFRAQQMINGFVNVTDEDCIAYTNDFESLFEELNKIIDTTERERDSYINEHIIRGDQPDTINITPRNVKNVMESFFNRQW